MCDATSDPTQALSCKCVRKFKNVHKTLVSRDALRGSHQQGDVLGDCSRSMSG
jgi:hypothetical protein